MKKCIYALFCLLSVILLLPVCAGAETKNMEFNLPEKIEKDAVFSVSWEDDDAKVKIELLSPGGKVYSAKKTPEAITSYKGNTIIYVGTAAKGLWKVKADGVNIGKLSVDAGQLPGSLEITKFTIKKSGEKYIAHYKVEDAPQRLGLAIYADTDGSGADGLPVWNGYGGKSGSISFSMDGLSAGEYHLYLMVTYDIAYSYKYSDKVISWQDSGYTREVENARAGRYNDGYYISWDYSEYEDYIVYIWDSGKNLERKEEIEGGGFYYGEFGKKQKKVYLAVVYAGGNCNYNKFEIKKSSGAEAETEYSIKDDITNQKSIVVSVSCKDKCTWEIYKDDVLAVESVKKKGDYIIGLSEGNNKFSVIVTDKYGNMREFDKELYVDTEAPALSVTEDVNRLVTNEDYVWIGGYSEAGAEVTLNDAKVELKKDYFNVKAELSKGENELRLVAKDVAGNITEYAAIVTYQPEKQGFFGKYMWLIAAGALALLYILTFSTALYNKKKVERGQGR